ncbi:uncharacterized protein C11orf24-like [Mytilus trossulus]|uniref:uncharacterized protein C11orf24-like n=1 Tax=Mytilus trossulus TaxID=6551 RepID=UPI00300655C6
MQSTGTSTPRTSLPVNKLALPALQTPSHFSSNTAPAAIAIVTAATTVPSASSLPIPTTSAPPPATTTSRKTPKGKTPINYQQLDTAFERLHFGQLEDREETVVFNTNRENCYKHSDDTTVPLEQPPRYHSSPVSPIFQQPYIPAWEKSSLPSPIKPIRPSVVLKPKFPASLATRAPKPTLKTPAQFSALYPILPPSSLPPAAPVSQLISQ